MEKKSQKYLKIESMLKNELLNKNEFKLNKGQYEQEIGNIPKMPFLKEKSALSQVLKDYGFEMIIETKVVSITIKRKK